VRVEGLTNDTLRVVVGACTCTGRTHCLISRHTRCDSLLLLLVLRLSCFLLLLLQWFLFSFLVYSLLIGIVLVCLVRTTDGGLLALLLTIDTAHMRIT
jgi:hypothetical protein